MISFGLQMVFIGVLSIDSSDQIYGNVSLKPRLE